MGGRAFLQLLPNATFPRLNPATYGVLKQTLLARVEEMYSAVSVPAEAPEKVDHGDLDFLVAEPCDGLLHEDIKSALGATATIENEGPRTSNFAVPLSAHGIVVPSTGGKGAVDNHEAMIQVDIHVCEDREDLDRIKFLHSYGDLGMILGVIPRGVGLQMGTKGLKVRKRAYETTCHILTVALDRRSPTSKASTSILPSLSIHSSHSCFLWMVLGALAKRVCYPI